MEIIDREGNPLNPKTWKITKFKAWTITMTTTVYLLRKGDLCNTKIEITAFSDPPLFFYSLICYQYTYA